MLFFDFGVGDLGGLRGPIHIDSNVGQGTTVDNNVLSGYGWPL